MLGHQLVLGNIHQQVRNLKGLNMVVGRKGLNDFLGRRRDALFVYDDGFVDTALG